MPSWDRRPFPTSRPFFSLSSLRQTLDT
ncbi:hypothetical protein CGRA01v4_08946 [Colletotrichum graminicola]|nr:hypothetical protein CGRA01v4_08946 [Colletotrichum graminicola]